MLFDRLGIERDFDQPRNGVAVLPLVFPAFFAFLGVINLAAQSLDILADKPAFLFHLFLVSQIGPDRDDQTFRAVLVFAAADFDPVQSVRNRFAGRNKGAAAGYPADGVFAVTDPIVFHPEGILFRFGFERGHGAER